MKVIAKKGTKCPMEKKPRKYITDSVAVEVPDTTYYKRLVREGSLSLAAAGPAPAPATQKAAAAAAPASGINKKEAKDDGKR